MDIEKMAEWLVSDADGHATDEAFAEFFVTLWKRQNGDKSPISEEDMKTFKLDNFINWLKGCLKEIIFDEDIDQGAWWKK